MNPNGPKWIQMVSHCLGNSLTDGFCIARVSVLHFCRLLFAWTVARPGHVVLFQLPNQDVKGGVELGFILSVWKGVKNPRMHSGETAVNSVMAFRCVCLSMIDQDHGFQLISFWLAAGEWQLIVNTYFLNPEVWIVYDCFSCFFHSFGVFPHISDQQDCAAEWQCGATSVAWTVRLESLICILDVESCAFGGK